MKNCFKSMKRLKLKLTSMILLVALLSLEFSPFAVKATAQTLNFYSPGSISVGYDSYNGKNVWYSNATLGGETAYCIDYSCTAPSGTMSFRDYLSNAGLTVLLHGYPNCSPSSIGCNSADEAYMATQMALWEVLNRTGESHKSGLIFRVDNVTPKAGKEGFYKRAVAAAQKLVAMAEANPYISTPTLVIDNANVKGNVQGDKVLIGPYNVSVEGVNVSDIKSITANLENAPASAVVVDANGNAKNSFGNNQAVYVRIDKSEDSKNFNIVFKTDCDRKIGCIYEKKGATAQDYVKISTEPVSANCKLEIKWEKVNSKGAIELVKVDQDKQPVVGARFKLTNASGKDLGEVETGNDGKINFYDVPEGGYTLTEVAAPEGYVIKEKSKNITVKAGEMAKVEFVNERVTGKLVITKIDDANKPLANVKFGIYNSKGQLIKEVVTDAQGKATVNLEYGKYYFKEVEAPAGYDMDTNTYSLSLDAENRTFYKTIVNNRHKGNLLVVKTDDEGTPIKGVKFNILDENSKVILTITTNEKGLAGAVNLPLGKYYYQEIEAPDDVVMDTAKHEFTVDSKDQIVRKDIVNEKISGKILITKVNEENKPISGVKFEILDSNRNVVDTITTGAEGKAESKELPKGTYYYKEISVPDGYIIDKSEHEFKIENKDQIVKKTVVNYTAQGSLKVKKVDPNGKPIANVKFNILNGKNEVVDTIVTNAEGIANSKKLEFGSYYFKEVEVPDNILLDDTIHPFELTENNQVITKTVVNEYIKGTLTIIKVDENDKPLAGVKFNIYDENKKVVDTIVTDNAGIAKSKELVKGKYYYQEIEAPKGIIVDKTMYEFEIVKNNQNVVKNMINYYEKGMLKIVKYDSNHKTLSGVKFEITDSKGNLVDTITTNSEGVATSKELTTGVYYYQEVYAPANVVMDKEKHKFELTEENQVVSKEVVNEIKTGKLTIIKVDENDKPLAGVKFNIYDLNKKLVDTIVTNDEGVAKSKELEMGKYYYQEIEAPEGIVVDNTMYEFEIVEDGQNVIKNMINYYAKGSLQIKKYDNHKQVLAGVKFEITDEKGVVVDTITTDDLGIANSKKLPLGTYYYQETEAPSHVVMDKEKHEFVLTENNQVITKTVENKVITGLLTIIKVDENEIPLEGVTFNIYDENKKLVDTIMTNEEGKAYSKELEKGKYYYQEVAAPEGIKIDNTLYEFEIVEDGQNVIKNMINYYIRGQIKIYKVEAGTTIALENAKFDILDENRNVVETIVTDANGIAITKPLVYGKYIIKEIEAPNGYEKDNNEYEINVVEEKVYESVIENVKKTLPQTGSNISSDLQIIAIVALVSILGYAIINLLKREEKQF